MTLRLRATFLLAAAIASQCLFAQTPSLTGNWQTVIQKLDDGTDYCAYFQLEQKGTEITGRVVYPWGFARVANGKVEGNRFRLEQPLWEGLTFVDEGEIAGNELKYRGTFWDGKPHDYVAHRVPEGEGNPPARLPLPALRPLPANGLAKVPPMGWNSWNKFQDKVTDQVVRDMADVIVATGMRDAGYIYINIDDTWQGQRDAKGVLQPNYKFPDMKSLAAYVHGKGLKLGIYSSPGPKTCAGYEGSFGHEEIDARTWAQWGIDYLKYDWCSAGKIYGDADLQPVYQKMGEALQKASRPIMYSLCEYGNGDVWKWGPQVGGNLWRTTGDIGDNWKSMATIGFDQGKLAPYAGPGHWNDPDMLEVGNGGLDGDESRTHMTLWSILAAPLLAGNDLRAMTPEIKSILMNKEVIAVDQDPLGKQGQPISKSGDQEVWAKPLDGGAVAVALFNRGESPVKMTLKVADLHLQLKGEARDLWSHSDVKLQNGEYSASVPRHGVVLLRLR